MPYTYDFNNLDNSVMNTYTSLGGGTYNMSQECKKYIIKYSCTSTYKACNSDKENTKNLCLNSVKEISECLELNSTYILEEKCSSNIITTSILPIISISLIVSFSL